MLNRMRGIIESQSINVRERSRRTISQRGFEVGTDVRVASPGPPDPLPPRTRPATGPGRTTILRLPQSDRSRKSLLRRSGRSFRGTWRATSRRLHRISAAKVLLDRVSLPGLLAIPIALVLVALIWLYVPLLDLYAYRSGFVLPGTDIGLSAEPTRFTGGSGEGMPLSVDPRDFEAIHRMEYEVRPNDTISEIAYTLGLDPGTILSANPISDVRRLLPGTMLSIPDRDGLFHDVQPGESLSSIADSYGVPLMPILDANDLSSSVLSVGETLFVPGASMDGDEYLLAIGELFSWPVRNFRFTSGYGMRSDPITGQWRMHTGIDLANAFGTPILAARAGRVVHVESNSGPYGNLVIIDHGDGFRSLYAHLSSFSVSTGQRVGTGQVIGRMGSTGRSTGSHLHFSVYRNNRPEDPLKHLP